MVETMASNSQPTASSMEAAARVSCPTSRCSRFMSARVLAMTGIALTPNATPRNNANVGRLAPLPSNATGTR